MIAYTTQPPAWDHRTGLDIWLERLYVEHRVRLIRCARRLVDDAAEAEDTVHEAFSRVARRSSTTDERYDIGYVYSVVMNVARDRLRQRQVRSCRPPAIWLGGDRAGTEIDDAADHIVLRDHIRRLPERQRQVVVMRFFEDLSERDIAAGLGISTGSVKTHASRALAALRSAVGCSSDAA